MEYSKFSEIQKQVNFIFKDFEFNNKSRVKIKEANKLLKAYEYNKDIQFYDIEEDYTNKKIIIKIKPFNDKDMIYVIQDDGCKN